MQTSRQRLAKTDPAGRITATADDGGDELFQNEILEGVSRTFALTIPELPGTLRTVVTNGYLLCRIADTIEDDPDLDTADKDRYFEGLLEDLERGGGCDSLSGLHLRLSPHTLADERILVREFPRIARVTGRLSEADRRALLRCVTIMSRGMREFERNRSPSGLADLAEVERYCYYVAGVVGEMLTDLFCNYSPQIAARRQTLAACAVDFGLGLQMTNILKDIWNDLERGTCWLPRALFARHGFDLERFDHVHGGREAEFAAAMREMVAVAHGKLRRALAYTLAIPRDEPGIRRFLIWAVLLAVLTLRNISADPLFHSREDVKVSRRTLKMTLGVSNAAIRSDAALRTLFALAAMGLPQPAAGEPAAQDDPTRPHSDC
jgi:farnesyl-diphosphate farnesyltransferase